MPYLDIDKACALDYLHEIRSLPKRMSVKRKVFQIDNGIWLKRVTIAFDSWFAMTCIERGASRVIALHESLPWPVNTNLDFRSLLGWQCAYICKRRRRCLFRQHIGLSFPKIFPDNVLQIMQMC